MKRAEVKLLRMVIMEFELEDGTIMRRTLKGDEANKWNGDINGLCVLADLHRSNPEWGKYGWEETVMGKKA